MEPGAGGGMKRFFEIWAFRLAAALLVWSVFSAGPVVAAERISVAYCVDCVPFQFKDDDGKPAGLIIDLWRLWSEKTGFKIDFRAAPWDETLRMVRDGKADVHAGLFFNDERNAYLEYGAPLVETDTHFFTHRDLPAIDTIEGLAGYKVGVLAGDFVEGFLKERLAPENIVRFESYEALMAALGGGELKVFAADTPTGIYHLKKTGLGETFTFPARKPLYRNNWHVAAGKGNTQLVAIIDGGMDLIETRERHQIAQAWSAEDDRKSAPPDPWENFSDVLTTEERQWLAEHQTIRLGVDPSYPPFDFIAEDGTYSGMAADYARIVGERLGVTLEVVPGLTWSQVIEGVKSGAVDVLPAVTQTAERDEFMNFSREHLNFPDVIFMRDDHNLIAGLPDMKGRKVALNEGSATYEHIDKNYPSVEKLIVGTALLGLKAVAEGKADATVQNLGVATYLIKKHNLTNLVVAAPADLGQPGLSFGVRKDWPELVPIIDKVLASIRPEEEAAIREKWGSTQYQIGIDVATVRRVALQAGGAVAVIVLFIFLWNRRLSREVKQRKQAEAALSQAREAAVAAETRLMDAIENVSEGFALFDADKRIILCNSMYRDIYGYEDMDTAPGTTIAKLTKLDIDHGVLSRELGGEEALSRRSKIYGETQETFDVPLADGRWIQIRDRPTLSGGTVSLHADITTHKQAEETLKAAKEEAEALAQSKSDFVAVVSHEVRTPMNGVLGMARLLEEMKLDSEQRECVNTIVASGEALLTIIDDLLDISKLEADKLELEKIPFMPADVVAQSMALMAPQAEEKGLAFTSTIDSAIPHVLIGDPHRLRQVLLNLLSNAIKFTERGSIRIEASVTLNTGSTVVVAFFVIDTGQGVSEEAQKKLFTDYTQASMEIARKHGGTGLGLAICRRLIGMMGGEISIESAPNEGSTFSFIAEFPVASEAETARLTEALDNPPLPPQAAKPAARPLHILQAEDNKTNRDVAEKILSRAGHRVTNVENGVEALDIIETGDFDIVLMDRDMPKMDGIEATRRIRAMDGPLASIPIIGITASAIPEQLNDCLEAGMNVCLTKPVEARHLCETLEQWAGGAMAVLVIDDTEINRTVAAKQLAKLGVPCDLAASGAQGLAMAGEKDYGAILADISMPGMDGLEFTGKFRQSPSQAGRRTPVIAMTGHKTPEDRKRFLDGGMDAVLTKPVVLEELAAVLGIGQGIEQAASGAPPGDAPPPAPGGSGKGLDQPPIDLGQLSEILGEEDEGELFLMLGLFVEGFPELLDALEGAVKKKDARSVSDRAHAAKSAATSAAAVALSGLLQTLETEAAGEDWRDIARQAGAVKTEFFRIEEFCGAPRTQA